MNNRKVWAVVVLIAVAVFVGCSVFLMNISSASKLPESVVHPVETVSPSTEPSQSPKPAGLEINWQELWDINEDVYAWIDIPGTDMSFPILQNENDDSYYLRRDINGNYLLAGSIFTEGSYNTKTFQDPVTLIYGHNMFDGATMFSPLEQFASQKVSTGDGIINIYTPDTKFTYTVFAGITYDNSHILYYNDFSNEQEYTNFFDKVYSVRDMRAYKNEELRPQYGDKVIILSTCLTINGDGRYLVMGVLTEETPISTQP